MTLLDKPLQIDEHEPFANDKKRDDFTFCSLFFFMSCADVWEDCIYKLGDLGYPVDGLSGDELPTLPLSSDPVVAPLIAKAIQDVALLLRIDCRFRYWRANFRKAPSPKRSALWMILCSLPFREGITSSSHSV